MRILIRYQKKGLMKFVSHLDVERVWHRAIRRADLPAVMTGGFSTREKMEMGYPLPVGCESEGEDLIVDLTESLPVEEIRMKLSGVLPEGFEIVKVIPYNYRDSLFHRTTGLLYRVSDRIITIPVAEGKSRNLYLVLGEELKISPDEARLLKVTRIEIQYKD